MQRKINEALRLKILLDTPRLNTNSAEQEAATTQNFVNHMAEQLVLANDLLRIETIQRAEAFELSEAAHIQDSIRRGPASAIFISRFRHEA